MAEEELTRWMLRTAERHGWAVAVADGANGGRGELTPEKKDEILGRLEQALERLMEQAR